MIKRNFTAALIAAVMLVSASVAQAIDLDDDSNQSTSQQWSQEIQFSDNSTQGTTANTVRAVPEMSTFFPIVGLLVAVGATHVLRRRRMARTNS